MSKNYLKSKGNDYGKRKNPEENKRIMTPAASIVLVAACVGTTLGNYSPPTYEVQAKETVNEEQSGQTNDEAETVKGSFNLPDGVYKGTGTGYAQRDVQSQFRFRIKKSCPLTY